MENTKLENVAIYLTEPDAKKFIAFQKNYVLFNFLLENKVFEQKNASVILDFDKLGVLKDIRRNDFLWSCKE